MVGYLDGMGTDIWCNDVSSGTSAEGNYERNIDGSGKHNCPWHAARLKIRHSPHLFVLLAQLLHVAIHRRLVCPGASHCRRHAVDANMWVQARAHAYVIEQTTQEKVFHWCRCAGRRLSRAR